MSSDAAWNDMLDEFRALGGVAENIRLGEGIYGRGLFPIDPAKPVNIQIPEDLLVSFEHVVIENGVFRVHADSAVGARGRAFLERYEQDFAWGPGHQDVERFLEGMSELPEHLRELLIKKFDFARFFDPITPEAVKKWFFGTRVIRAGGRQVVMPIIEMANHGGTGAYDVKSGVALRGIFDGEVLVRYTTPSDPLDMFLNWTFPSRESTGFSVEILTTCAGRQVEILRKFHADSPIPRVPNVRIDGDRIIMQYLLLGDQQFPRVPKGAFRRAMQQVGLNDVDEVFDFINFANRQEFLDLLDALEGIDLSIVPTLRKLAVNQLRALSCHFGVRQI